MEQLNPELEACIKFHGHLCPGLMIGYRVAILAREKLGLKRSADEELVAIVENNSCAVDAVQFINGATFGKGNLIFEDHGIHAYTFIERRSEKQIRIELKQDIFQDESGKRKELLQKRSKNIPLTDEETLFFEENRKSTIDKLLKMADEDLFYTKDTSIKIPEKASIFSSLQCTKCKLGVMETKIRVLNEQYYCIPCWKKELNIQ